MSRVFHLSVLVALALVAAPAADDEAAQPVLALTASNFTARAGATLAGEEWLLAPTGAVACAVTFATNQTCMLVVVARAEAAAQLAVRLDADTIATATVASTNLSSYSIQVPAKGGDRALVLAAAGGTNRLAIASVMLLGTPLPRVTSTNQAQRAAWDTPIGR
jgi:hypothetical protein